MARSDRTSVHNASMLQHKPKNLNHRLDPDSLLAMKAVRLVVISIIVEPLDRPVQSRLT